MAVHSSILSWRNPWTEEPGGLQSVGLQRVRHDGAHTHTHTHTHTHFKWFSNVYIVSKALTFPRVKGDILLGLVDDSNLALIHKNCVYDQYFKSIL